MRADGELYCDRCRRAIPRGTFSLTILDTRTVCQHCHEAEEAPPSGRGKGKAARSCYICGEAFSRSGPHRTLPEGGAVCGRCDAQRASGERRPLPLQHRERLSPQPSEDLPPPPPPPQLSRTPRPSGEAAQAPGKTAQAPGGAAKPNGIAAALSFLIPGLGQLYKGQVGRGLAFFFGWVVGAALFVVPALVVWVVNIFDAARS